MKYLTKLLGVILIAGILFSGNANALNTKVAYTGVWGNGGVFIQLTTTYNLAGCSSPEIWVGALHPAKKEILSIAMAAVASGKEVGITVDACSGSGGRPLFSEGTGSNIYLIN